MEETKPIQDLWASLADILPTGWRSGSAAAVLEGLSFIDALLSLEDNDRFTLTTTIGADTPIDLSIPGLPDLGITVGEFDSFGYTVELEYASGVLSASVVDVPITIYLPDSFLRPVDDEDGLGLIGQGIFRISSQGEIQAQLVNGLDLPPCFLGDSGIVISASSLKADLSFANSPPEVLAAGFDESFVGIYFQEVRITLPAGFPSIAPEDLILKKCVIGSGGVSGELDLTYDPVYDETSKKFSGPGACDLFGIPFGLKRVEIGLRKNALTKASFTGKLLLPFFEEPVEVDVGFDLDGNVTIEITDGAGGLKTITKPNTMSIELDSIGAELKDGLFTAKISGRLTPLFGKDKGLNWPAFDVKELSIDSKGHVHLDGGWLNVPEQKTLNFYGFKIEISQLGFGTNDNGTRWVGFSGALHLVDGLQAGASVEGLRITWNPAEANPSPKITLNGAGVELTIPDVLHLKGAVSYREITDDAGHSIHRFDGDIHLTLEALDLDIDGTLVIGSDTGPAGRYNFFAIYIDVELPTGIPLFSTGLGLYGFAGLFALQMEPSKMADEAWFSVDKKKDYYHRNPVGITALREKWKPSQGSFAFGAGVTLATLADNGYTFNGKFLLAIVIPGPIVLLQGAASFLKKRADRDSEGQFRALAVLDGRAGSILVGLDAEYKTGSGGELIDLHGSMEAYYAFHDPGKWHLYLGKNEPREQRIRALFARLVEANAYFMLDAHQLALGAWFGYNNGWSFGPLSVRLEAWADGNALLSFRPSQFHGDLWLHAQVDLKAFGIGLGLSLDAKIAADLFKPYHLRGEFSVGIRIFRKKIGATIVLEWGPEKQAPPLPLPVVSVGIEHLKSAVTWPLPRPTLLLPSFDDGAGFLVANKPATVPDPSEDDVPRVPLDARIALTFARSVHDGAMVGSNLQAVLPDFEAIGNPAGGSVLQVRYVLDAVVLERQGDKGWQTVAASTGSGSSYPPLRGVWSVVPPLPDGSSPAGSRGQTKILLGAKNPFEFNRHTGSSWEEWASDALPSYPCLPVQSAEETCFGFGGLQPQSSIPSPWTYPGPPAVTFSWGFGPATAGTRTVDKGGGVVRKIPLLCFPEAAVRHGIRVQSAAPGAKFRFTLAQPDAPPSPTTLFAIETREISTIEATCVDVRTRVAGTLANPWKAEEGALFTVRGTDGELLPVARIERWGQGALGLNAGFELGVDLPSPAQWVTLLITHRPPFRIVAFNAAGAAVATHAPNGTGGTSTETVRLDGPAITRVVVYASGNEKLIHQVCFLIPSPSGPRATGYGVDGTAFGPFVPVNGAIQVEGPEMPVVVLTGDGPLCLAQVCVTPDPEAGQVVRQDQRIQQQTDGLTHWEAKGEVLAPDSFYRVTVKTHLDVNLSISGLTGLPADLAPVEYAYFRTGGPPGLTALSKPAGVNTDPFATGLEDLTRYVESTTPPTVPKPGEKPILYKPFYRAYDVGLEFNEDYVEQMYRMDRRDLGLYLYDASNQPALDGLGRLLVLNDQWGTAETVSLSESEQRWVTLIDAATCLPKKLDPKTFPKDDALASSDSGRVLAPDTLYEARLVSLLFHETFEGPNPPDLPAGWYAEDAGPGGFSNWQVGEVGEPPSRFVEQRSAIGGGVSPERPGTLLLFAGSAGWTDYRVSVYLRAPAGAVGVMVRSRGRGTGYRFSLDGRVRRLVKFGPAGVTRLGEDDLAYRKNRDYLVTVEAIGKSLRCYVDGEPVFDVEDGDFAAGGIGLYSCQSPGARFTDVRVDDLGKAAPAVYRFQLTTSLYANFFHHLHSYQDETWKAAQDLATDPTVDAMLSEAVIPSFSPPSEGEARAYDRLARLALKQATPQNPAQVEVTRLEKAGAPVAFLLRGPEPLAWDRVEFALSSTPRHLPAPDTPGAVKLTDATFGTVLPTDESATLLLREATDLSRYRVELRALPGVLAEPADDPVLLAERFGGDPAAARARFTVVDQGTANGPSDWRVEGGALIQISEIGGGAEPALPGTVAWTGEDGWTDYRYSADLRCDSGGTLGVVFRWVDADNHYRLSLDASRRYRRLIKREKGQVSVLWEDGQGYTAGAPFQLTVEAMGSRLTGFLGNGRLFEVTDATHAAGPVGLYCAGNPDARFDAVEVRRPSLDALALLRDRFATGDLTQWARIDEAPGTQPSALEAAGGEAILRSFVQQGGSPAYPGTYAYTGEGGWTDAVYSARLRCPSGGTLGLVFRGRDLKNYYRFSMNSAPGPYRRLVKQVNGQLTVLWQDGGAYAPDQPHEVTVVAMGNSLRGYLDGVPLFAVTDGDIPSGFIGLYSRNNSDARFSQVRVFPAGLAFAGWGLDEPFDSLVPDRWSFLDAQAKPLPDSWAVEAGALRPAGANPASPHLALTGDAAAADYRLIVRLRRGTAGVAGIVFRYLDADNGFRFASESLERRLVKRVQGKETVLWQGRGGLPPGREVLLTFDVVGQHLIGWLDGQELFRLDDADLPAGRVGLFADGSPDVRFTEVRVAEPEWTPWYAFGGEDRRPAGSRVRVHSGAETAAAPSEAGLEHRFAAPPGETGRLRFPSGGAELRVVTPAGPGHRRTFVPPAEYGAFAGPKVIRRADGTGLVLLPLGAPSPLSEGQYRVDLTYHRERAGQVHTFSQAGDLAPERAVIDIPWQAR